MEALWRILMMLVSVAVALFAWWFAIRHWGALTFFVASLSTLWAARATAALLHWSRTDADAGSVE